MSTTVNVDGWCRALADALLPPEVSAGRPVRLNSDDAAVSEAARRLGISRTSAVTELTACLRAEGLVSNTMGVGPLARASDGDPPRYLGGLALLVLAASRMAPGKDNTMAAYYLRLADLLGIPLRDTHPGVAGVPELVARFDDLADWLEVDQAGARGLLDIPASYHPSIVGLPISQALLRAGDRTTLGAFFERTSRLIDAGWDPVHQLCQWGGRHYLSAPLQQLLERADLHAPLAGALRAARRNWDGSTADAEGRRLLAGQLALHLPPLPFTISITVSALSEKVSATGPGGEEIELDPQTPAAVPLDWLRIAEGGPVIAAAGDERIRVLNGPTMLFEVTALGVEAVAAAAEDPVWVLTCEPRLMDACPPESRYRVALPAGWELLSDIDPGLLEEELRVHAAEEDRPLTGVATVGGLRLGPEVWLLDHPPAIVADVPEPAPVTIDGTAHGDIETGRPLTLEQIASRPGIHQIDVGEQRLTVELAARGPRTGIGELGFDLDPRYVHAGAGPLRETDSASVIGPLTSPPPSPAAELPMIVRYRCDVDAIDSDGTVRALAPPPPTPWLEHVGLPADGPWPIPDPSRVVWLCVNAAAGKFVVAWQAFDVPTSDDVLDTVDWYADAMRIVDRSGGGATERWQRLLHAAEVAE
ncbi:MAG: hypothetical protein ACR2KP_00670 [Egibacteraceae bacterium]